MRKRSVAFLLSLACMLNLLMSSVAPLRAEALAEGELTQPIELTTVEEMSDETTTISPTSASPSQDPVAETSGETVAETVAETSSEEAVGETSGETSSEETVGETSGETSVEETTGETSGEPTVEKTSGEPTVEEISGETTAGETSATATSDATTAEETSTETTVPETSETTEETAKQHSGPVTIPSTNTFYLIDQNNPVLKSESDFAIGKKGEYEFGLTFKVALRDIPEEVRTGVVAEFVIPADFTLLQIPSLHNVTILKKTLPDRSTLVTVIFEDILTDSVTGQFYIRQNATALLNNFATNGGNFPFTMRLYTHYGTDEQALVLTSESAEDYTERILFTANTQPPTYTVSSPTNTEAWMPADVYVNTQANPSRIINRVVSAADDITYLISGKGASETRVAHFALNFHKTEGYLRNNTAFNFIFPKQGTEATSLFNGQYLRETTFTTDDGIVYVIKSLTPNEVVGTKSSGPYLLQGATLAGSTTGSEFTSPLTTHPNLSYADVFYKAGTFDIKLYPVAYYNRLYQGDWSQTIYTADAGSYVSYKAADGSDLTATGDPLVFQFVQGDIAPKPVTEIDLHINGYNLAKVAQYSSQQPRYNDSEPVSAIVNFNDYTRSFQIMDDFKLTYDYEEALSPVSLSGLRTSKDYGFSYRMTITNAVTGQVERIETLVDEERWAAGYTPETIGGVTETASSGSAGTWTFADADAADNTLYVSRVEVLKPVYEYNKIGAQGSGATPYFTSVLRAYHHRLSDGTDIPDKYKAIVRRSADSRQITASNGGPFIKEVPVLTLHLNDNLVVGTSNITEQMEVNDHNKTGYFLYYSVRKNTDTMNYNTDTEGNAIAFGAEGYDPVVTEISGDAVTLIDRMSRTDQRLLGIWDDQGVYHDLRSAGIDPEQAPYLFEGKTLVPTDAEAVIPHPTHNYGPYGTGLNEMTYNLKAIYDALGIPYATRLVVAHDEVNSWVVPNDYINRQMKVSINTVKPGYLNFDGAIGGAENLPKRLPYKVTLYCQYQDYVAEVVDGGDPVDGNGGTIHGTNNARTGNSVPIVHGSYPSGISILEDDYVVNPYAPVTDVRGKVIAGNIGASHMPESERLANVIVHTDAVNARGLELTRVVVPIPSGIQMQYVNTGIDFTGTDPRLLSLANTVSFDKSGWMEGYDIVFDYTLSNGETRSEAVRVQSSWATGSRMHYLLPGVDTAAGVTLTSLRVNLKNKTNWGNNSLDITPGAGLNTKIPSIGLGRYQEVIPAVYPGTTDTIGSVSTHDAAEDYDKLGVKATLYIENLFGQQLGGSGAYIAEGASYRIQAQRVEVENLTLRGSRYTGTSTNQGEQLTFHAQLNSYYSPMTWQLKEKTNTILNPVYYLKIDKSFSYVPDSITGLPEGAYASYIPAGKGEGASGDPDFGYLIVSYSEVPEASMPTKTNPLVAGGMWQTYDYLTFDFKLLVRYDAVPGDTVIVHGVWMDLPADGARPTSPAIPEDAVPAEVTDGQGVLLEGAPSGAVFGNADQTLDSNGDGSAEMLYAPLTTQHRILKQAITGAVPFVVAKKPFDESTVSVSSRDLTSVQNLYSLKMYMNGDLNLVTYDWEVYVPVPKKGDSYQFRNPIVPALTRPNDFSMDVISVDTSQLDAQGFTYQVWYTTDANPATGAYAGVKSANWVSTGHWTENLPDDLSTITMIKVTLDEMPPKDLGIFQVNYALTEHKNVVGPLEDGMVTYANYRIYEGEYVFGELGQISMPQKYMLLDMAVSGFVWDESDYNSTYNKSTDAFANGIEMKMYDMDGNEIVQTDVATHITNTKGKYSLLLPRDGEMQLEIELPEGKRLVSPKVNDDPTIDSAFDRTTRRTTINFTADPIRKLYELGDVNAGIYTAPVLSFTPDPIFVHVTDTATLTANIAHQAQVPDGDKVRYEAPVDQTVATLEDNGDHTAIITGYKATVTTGQAYVTDGYGGEVSGTYEVAVYVNALYDLNGGTGTAPVDDNRYYVSEPNEPPTDLATVLDNEGVIPPTGYHFLRWTTNPDGTGSQMTPGGTFTTGDRAEDVTLYAIYEPNPYEVVFNANSGVGDDVEQAFVYDTAQDLRANTFTKPDHRFLGWGRAATATEVDLADGENVINLTTELDGVVTLYALWEELPLITYNYVSANPAQGKTAPVTESIKPDTGTPEGSMATGQPGYHPTKWTNEADEVVGTAAQFIPTKDPATFGQTFTFKAHFAPNPYTVTFDANEGTGEMESQAFIYDEPQALTENAFTRADYSFLGWSTDPAATTATYADAQEVVNLTTELDGNVTLYAVWYKLPVITYEYVSAQPTMGGVSLAAEGVEPDSGTPQGSTAQPEVGHHFLKWTDVEDAQVGDELYYQPTKDPADFGKTFRFTAHFAPNPYTVSFDANGGEGEMLPQDFIYNVPEKLTENTFSRPDFRFRGWSTTPDAVEPEFLDAQEVANLTAERDGEVTLYAVWLELEPIRYLYLTADAVTGSVSVSEEIVKADTGVPKGSTAEPNAGYRTSYWLNEAGEAVSTEALFIPEHKSEDHGKTLTFTAYFTPNTYTVRFNANEGEGEVSEQAFVYDAEQALTPVAFTRTNYVFKGWSTTPTGKVAYTDNETVKNLTSEHEATVELYAVWEEMSPVHFVYAVSDPAHATLSLTEETLMPEGGVAEGSTVTVSTGYRFVTWHDADGNSVANTLTYVPTVKPEDSGKTLRFTAGIAPNEYTVRFDANGGTGTMADQLFAYDTALKLSPNGFTRSGFEFEHWMDAEGNIYTDEQAVLNLRSEHGAVVVLQAVWKQLPTLPTTQPTTTDPITVPTTTQPTGTPVARTGEHGPGAELFLGFSLLIGAGFLVLRRRPYYE